MTDLGAEARKLSQLARQVRLEVEIAELAAGDPTYTMPQVWRYCPNCYALADSNSLLKRCARCPTSPNNVLVVLPLDPDAAQAALRIGGVPALVTMIVAVVAGPDVAVEPASNGIGAHHVGCAANYGEVCDMGCVDTW